MVGIVVVGIVEVVIVAVDAAVVVAVVIAIVVVINKSPPGHQRHRLNESYGVEGHY